MLKLAYQIKEKRNYDMKTFDPKMYTIEDARHELQFMDDKEVSDYINFIKTWKVNKNNKAMYTAWMIIAAEMERK